ncbi:hypothetical protein ACFSQP_02220 [Bizionia sediminis]|uniref:Peptidase M23 n=1 Tax=Bizionia sediminis TaxID=1737064 RepID=A0ABW5KQP0_9FLAO
MKKGKLHTIKNAGFKAPENYFKSFDVSFSAKKPYKPSKQSSGFKVPENYFETFKVPSPKTDPVTKNKAKVVSLFSKKAMLYAASVAAVIAVLLSIPNIQKSVTFSSIDTESIENYLLTSEFEFMELDNLIKDPATLERNIYSKTISDGSLESYLYSNLDVEDFNIE